MRAANDSGPRQPGWIKHVVVHCTEGSPGVFPRQPSASGVAAYFARPDTRASTQLVVDDKGCYRCVPDLVIPWGAPGVNRSGLHVELCGWTRWTREQWLARELTLRLAADRCARWAWTFKIPRAWLTAAQLKDGRRGFVTHAVASQAFTPGGHTDPGANFPRDVFMQYVRDAYTRIVEERQL